MNNKRLLTQKGGNFVIKDRDNSPDQLFVFDPASKTIQTYANQGRSVAIQHDGKNRNVVSEDTDGGWYQLFTVDGSQIMNMRGLVLSVEGDKDLNGQNVIAWKKNKSTTLSQSWTITYVDSEWISNGIIPDKPFTVISKLKSGRALTRAGDKLVI